ncbi:MAG: BREX system P-loop protein BrxC [Aridibacter sp.]
MLAGANKADVSRVLYFKVLQWAGYSQNLKVFALERKIEKDGKWKEFEDKINNSFPELTWKDLQNDPLIVDGFIPKIAHELYPALFPSETSFNSNIEDFLKSEDQQVAEMIEIVRDKSGKEHIIFVVDEVGQYVASGENLILNLDGLAKNLKRIGDGKVWMVATAQQTLTEDDEKAAINTAKLFKLKDRFPIQVDLESRDIKEICTKRLLGKSPTGEKELGKLFDEKGAALRHSTKLQDAKYYESELDKDKFVDLYPFLPAHFDILLQLLGKLAKSTGGIGLRSAIKVVQDVLIEDSGNKSPVAKNEVGWLATTVTLFDTLDRDIKRSFANIYAGLENTLIRFPDSKTHQDIAKTIVVLQVLNSLPATLQNISALMHPSVSSPSIQDEVREAIDEMLKDSKVPLSEKDGQYFFLSPKLKEIEAEKNELPLRTGDVRRIFNENLKEAFSPLPKVNINDSLTVSTGVKLFIGSQIVPIAGEKNPVQTMIEFVSKTEYDSAKTRLINNSSETINQNNVYLLGVEDPKAEELAGEIYRCQKIIDNHRSDPDQEIRDYRESQQDRKQTLSNELTRIINKSLEQGSFIFRGRNTPISSLDQNILNSAKKFLTEVAEQVFERYSEAPVRAETTLAEKFLRVPNPASLTNALDPLGLFTISSGTPTFQSDHKAIVSIRDYIERNGMVEGKRLVDKFTAPPFGWSPDTLRYILAAMLVGGEIKLRVSGNDIKTVGQKAIDALKTNTSFRGVGVALRDERPSPEVSARAATRLTDLIGDMVVPLEQEISQKAVKKIPQFQNDFLPLVEKLEILGLPGKERIENLSQELRDIIASDGSEATSRLGGETSGLYDNLIWAKEVKSVLADGLESTVKKIQSYKREKESLPASGVPGELQSELSTIIEKIQPRLEDEDFYTFAVDFNTALTDCNARIAVACNDLTSNLKERIEKGIEELELLPEWQHLTKEERDNASGDLNDFDLEATKDFTGFKSLQAKEYDFNSRLAELKDQIRKTVQERLKPEEGERKLSKNIPVKTRVTDKSELDKLIQELQSIRSQMAFYSELEINFTIEDE